MATPAWIGATPGQPQLAAQVNQFLGTHAVACVYTGVSISSQGTVGSGGSATNGLWVAQSFTTGASSFGVGRVRLNVSYTGAPPPVTVGVFASSGSAPVGPALVSTVVPAQYFTAAGATVSIPVPFAGLAASTGYWIVVEAVGDASDYYSINYSDQASGASTSSDGVVWAPLAHGLIYNVLDLTALAPLAHTWEDSGARWTALTENGSGQPTSLVEYTVGQTATGYASSAAYLAYTGSALTGVSASGTPAWSAARSGLIGDAAAIAGSAQINQLLGTHAADLVYQGNQILTPAGQGASAWALPLAASDVDEPFTMSGTSIGRVQVPLLAVGDGADLLVSLCADSSGSPGTVITQTRIPASWIYQLSAVSGVSGPSTQAPSTQATGSPLAVAQFNNLVIGPYATQPFSPPATGSANIANPAIAQAGNYLLNVGGANQSSGALVSSVFTALASGTTLAPLTPSASMPQTGYSGALAVTSDTVVLAGGFVTASDTVATTSVFAASWDGQGGIGAWSAQQPLPSASQYAGVATSGENVYILGGFNNSAYLNTVYWATVSNNQITAWNTGAPLPQQLSNTSCIALNGFLFVVGGENSSVQSLACYYAAINTDGSLGNWVTGPSVPAPVINGGNQVVATSQALIVTGDDTYTLGVTASGPGPAWSLQNDINFTSQPEWILVPAAGADYTLFTVLPLDPLSGRYRTAPVTQTPMISVPLPATGLTSGATYHVLMQQLGGDLNNYLRTHTDVDVFPGNPTLLTSARGAFSWSAASPAGTAVPMQVFDNPGPPFPGAFPWHMWEDSGARVTTVVCATTPDHRLLGVCEATQISSAQNSNQGFESGIAPWTVTGGTVAQSTAQVYEGEFSAQVTPSGTAAQVSLLSELMPCMPGQSINVTAWAWFTGAVTGAWGVVVNWYTLTGTYLATSSPTFASAPAGTWTNSASTFTAPATAYRYTFGPLLGGTPSSSQVFYVDVAHSYPTTVGPQLSSVTALTYPGTWPGKTWPVTGTTVLA